MATTRQNTTYQLTSGLFLFNQTSQRTKPCWTPKGRNVESAIKTRKPMIILMYQCPERLTVWSWLEGTMRQMGCSSSNEDLIRGHFGPVGNLQLSFTLLAAYLYINWKARVEDTMSRRFQRASGKSFGNLDPNSLNQPALTEIDC
ncbi:hypothetical protein OUZ56_024474 [Daphnia magna]|uniref:Uncharacterized protein n=1 Tax=Daphnia magna TaxID=35525 RepID=A0ABR0B0V3_9CRUS|nr:hypothetical protein OUZ56_024474 [Daphnia magna]